MSPRSSLTFRFALTLMLAIGAGVIWGFLVAWIAMLVGQIISEPYQYRQFTVTINGTPYISHYTPDGYTYETLDGKPVPPGKEAEVIVQELDAAGLSVPHDPQWPISSLNWGQRMILFVDPGPPEIHWFFVHNGEIESGAGYFVGYHSKTKHRLGWFARQGFRHEVPPADEWFPVDGRRMQDRTAFPTLTQYYRFGIWQEYNRSADETFPLHVTHLISEGKLWRIDFREHTAKVAYAEKDLLSFARLSRAMDMPPENAKRYIPRPERFVALRLPDQVIVLDPRSEDRLTYQIPEMLRHLTFNFYELQNGQAIVTFSPRRDPEAEARLMEISQKGEVVSQAMIPRRPTRWYDRPVTISSILAVAIPAPIVAIFATPAPYAAEFLEAGEPSLVRVWLWGLRNTWPQLLLVFLVAVAAAAWVHRRQKRLGQPHPVFWTSFVFLGGLPGLIGYLVHRSWPVVEPCPNCLQPAPRDREACLHCGEEFPSPARQGIEVFAA